MLKGKNILDCINLLSSNKYEKNDKLRIQKRLIFNNVITSSLLNLHVLVQ